MNDISKLKIEIIIDTITALLPTGIPIFIKDPDGATSFISNILKTYVVMGIESGKVIKKIKRKISLKL